MGELELGGSAVVEAIDQPTVVLSEDDSVIECNDEFRELVGDSDPDSLDSALAELPGLLEQMRAREAGIGSAECADTTYYYHVRVSHIQTDDEPVADLVVLHDITAQQHQQHELERQNERLDQFASIISHDLRNPLDVAIGRTTALDELVDDPQADTHLSELQAAHERMRAIIRDVLTLAREGQSIDDTAAVDLANVANNAWTHVETEPARLDVDASIVVIADRDRLERIFENLFRNSIEHGLPAADTDDRTLSVRVGPLEEQTGFYVADDGRGLSKDHPEQLLEPGYTDREGNTGLGLSIVRNIAEAHGWEIAVCPSADGGARFEFSGVKQATDGTVARGD